MKPTVYYNPIEKTLKFAAPNDLGADYGETPLYTAHEIADFVRSLYFDDTLTGNETFSDIADRIERQDHYARP